MPLSGELWPAHPKPLPDELLSSWIVRIASANGLKLQTFCDRVFGKEHQLWNRDIDRHAPPWLLASLARHTGTPIKHVRDATLEVYRGRLYRRKHDAGQLRWILPAGVYHRTRRHFGVQFCPQCLAEDHEPYFRTRWRGFYPEITDGCKRAWNFRSCLAALRRILGLWNRSMYSNTSARAASSVGYFMR